MNLYIFCKKLCPFIVWPWTNGGHLGFVTHNAMSEFFSDNTTMSGSPENHIIDTKNTNLRLLCRKWYQFIAWLWTNGGHLGYFTHNAISKIFPTCIFLPTIQSKIFSDNTTMSGIHENPRIDTKNTNISLLCQKWYQLIVWPWTNGGHLEFFTHNAMSKIFSDNTTISGIHENPRIDTKNANKPLLCLFWQHHYVRLTWKPHNRHQKHESASIMSKIFPTTPQCPAYLKTPW